MKSYFDPSTCPETGETAIFFSVVSSNFQNCALDMGWILECIRERWAERGRGTAACAAARADRCSRPDVSDWNAAQEATQGATTQTAGAAIGRREPEHMPGGKKTGEHPMESGEITRGGSRRQKKANSAGVEIVEDELRPYRAAETDKNLFGVEAGRQNAQGVQTGQPRSGRGGKETHNFRQIRMAGRPFRRGSGAGNLP